MKGTLSDSEMEERKGTNRTEGQVSAHTITNGPAHRGPQSPQDGI